LDCWSVTKWTSAEYVMLGPRHCFARLYLHRITSVVISELASCQKEFQNPVMKALRYKQLDATCFRKYRDACSVTSLNRMKHCRWAVGARAPPPAPSPLPPLEPPQKLPWPNRKMGSYMLPSFACADRGRGDMKQTYLVGAGPRSFSLLS